VNAAPSVILSRNERTRLEFLVTETRGPRALRKRAQAILLCAKGKTNLQVAGEIGITNLTVGRWRREFLLNRLKDFGVENRGRSVPPILLSNAESKTLQGWLRSGSAALATRARVILACARGARNSVVANETGVSKQTVSNLRRRFVSDRLGGLVPRQTGRPPLRASSNR
jgi:transposase